MKTLLTIEQQKAWMQGNYRNTDLQHRWSCRGYGNSKILNRVNDVLSKASGCGYDRYGSALGSAIMELFPEELLKLAKRECKGRRREYKGAPNFYGLFYNSKTGRAWLDGACGESCMIRVLNKIGFSLRQVGSTGNSGNTGSVFYSLSPISKHERKYFA